MNNIYAASRQWASRPKDERFESLQALIQNAEADKAAGRRIFRPLSDLQVVPAGADLKLASKSTSKQVGFTNWSFGQLAGQAEAPARYLRTLPAEQAAADLNFSLGIAAQRDDSDKQLYVRNGGDNILRALTTPAYVRVHDADVARRALQIADANGLELPRTWSGEHAGAYRGDRNMFLFLTNGGSIVEDPTLRGGDGAMFRGVIIRNSEVGSDLAEVWTFLFRFVCGNHIIWEADTFSQQTRRHVGKVAEDFDAMLDRAVRFFAAPASADKAKIERLVNAQVGKDAEEVIEFGRKVGLTLKAAEATYNQAVAYENNPLSAWGFINGLTRHSQTLDNQDERFALDIVASKLTRQYAAA